MAPLQTLTALAAVSALVLLVARPTVAVGNVFMAACNRSSMPTVPTDQWKDMSRGEGVNEWMK